MSYYNAQGRVLRCGFETNFALFNAETRAWDMIPPLDVENFLDVIEERNRLTNEEAERLTGVPCPDSPYVVSAVHYWRLDDGSIVRDGRNISGEIWDKHSKEWIKFAGMIDSYIGELNISEITPEEAERRTGTECIREF